MIDTKDYAKLREAIYTIKNECASHKSSCLGCPFLVGDHTCGITGIKMVGQYDYKKQPSYWKIPDIKLMDEVLE